MNIPARRLAPLALLAPLAWGAAGCASSALPTEAPPLAGLEEPFALRLEPDDEAGRRELAAGGFTGVILDEAPQALDEGLGAAPAGLPVVGVVANSPAQAAGLLPGDLLVAVGEDERPLEWTSEWREVELAAEPGTRLHVIADRAGREYAADIEVEARLAPAPRAAAQRYRETDRVGVVVRTATEVEARAAGLAPGAGAVVVGLSADSPWRAGAGGVVFGDLIVAVDGRPVAHPQVLLDALRGAADHARLRLDVRRDDRRLQLTLPLSRRAQELRQVGVPLLFSYAERPDSSRTSVLLGLFRLRRTRVAWDVRLFWLLSFGGGDADRLEEVRE